MKLVSTVVPVAATLLGLMALTFFIGRLLPLDPVLAILGDNAGKEAYDTVYRQLGLDKPLWFQFWLYLKNSLSLDFGTSLMTSEPVLTDIKRVFPATLELATVALIIGTGVGIPLGMTAAMYRDTIVDHIARAVGLIGFSTPHFWLGLMGLVLLYAQLGWVAGPGRIDVAYEYDIERATGLLLVDTAIAGQWEIFRNTFSHIILPASILGFSALAYISRMTRSFAIEQLGHEYVLMARVKGLSWACTIRRHVLPNIAIQLITVVALAYAFLLEGAVLTETVFAWPGFGRYLTNSLLAGDMNAVLGCTIVVGSIFIGVNLLSDVLYRVLDPRAR